MKLSQAYPTLRIELAGDFLLQFVHNEDCHWKFERIGFFIKQLDGTFKFEYSTEQEKLNFAEIIQSDDPVNTFLRLHQEIEEKWQRKEFRYFKEDK
jgi:hypothetical protein